MAEPLEVHDFHSSPVFADEGPHGYSATGGNPGNPGGGHKPPHTPYTGSGVDKHLTNGYSTLHGEPVVHEETPLSPEEQAQHSYESRVKGLHANPAGSVPGWPDAPEMHRAEFEMDQAELKAHPNAGYVHPRYPSLEAAQAADRHDIAKNAYLNAPENIAARKAGTSLEQQASNFENTYQDQNTPQVGPKPPAMANPSGQTE